MRTPTFDSRALAGLFLAVLVVLALFSAGSGTAPAEVRLVPCPVHALTDVPCPGCGITRASVAFVRGELATAWSLHPFAFLLVPLALLALVAPRGLRRTWSALPDVLRRALPAAGLLLALALWIARLA